MNSVKDIALVFCATSVLLSAITLTGVGKLEKSKNYIIALIMLCSVIGSVSKADFSLVMPDLATEVETTSASVEEISRYQAEYLIEQLFLKENIKYNKISANATKTEDDSIIITEIILSGVSDRQGALTALKGVGIDCRVVFD